MFLAWNWLQLIVEGGFAFAHADKLFALSFMCLCVIIANKHINRIIFEACNSGHEILFCLIKCKFLCVLSYCVFEFFFSSSSCL